MGADVGDGVVPDRVGLYHVGLGKVNLSSVQRTDAAHKVEKNEVDARVTALVSYGPAAFCGEFCRSRA